MIIKTINPIIVNGARESRPSEYLSFDGRKASKKQLEAFQRFANSKGMKPALKVDGVYGKNTQKAIDLYGAEWNKMAGVMTNIMTNPLNPVGSGGGSSTPSQAEQIEQAKQGMVWDKARGWVESGKAKDLLANIQSQGGIKGFLGSIFGGGGNQMSQPSSDTTQSTETTMSTPDGKPKWSTTKKIVVFGGGAVVLGLIIYFATRPKK